MFAAVLLCAAPVAPVRGQAGPVGAIAGRVTLTSRMRGVPIGTNAYAPRAITQQAPPAVPEMRSVVVYLRGVTFSGSLPVTHEQIRQEHESFVPRVLALTRGSTVEFPNGDPFFHNVFSLSGSDTFDLGRYPDGQARSRLFTKAGVVKVYCHIHSHMSATILVLDHPYFVTPDADGRFTLAGVPVGSYTLVGWHERVGEERTPVTVTAGQTTAADISLPVGTSR